METQLTNTPAGENNSNPSWSVELTAEYESTDSHGSKFGVELAGTGTVTIDWGDGTVLENIQMPELKELKKESDAGHEWYKYEGAEYTHPYDKVGSYSVKISGQGGDMTLLRLQKKADFSSVVLNHCDRLQRFNCFDTKLTSLDLSGCTQLKELDCSGNDLLTTLDVSECTPLDLLACSYNELTSLDISKNTQLKWLVCYGNPLSVEATNQIYNDLPVVGQGEGNIFVNQGTAGDYRLAEAKGWKVDFRQ